MIDYFGLSADFVLLMVVVIPVAAYWVATLIDDGDI